MTARAAREPEILAHGDIAGGNAQVCEPWPRGVSREPTLAIGAVVKILQREFPATTVSKVRFLEDKGLVAPHRSASGYRKFSLADVERLRFILAQQRDSYAPLKVIHENLQALDGGHDVEPAPKARLVAVEGKSVAPSGRATITATELSDLTGATRENLESYVEAGLIAPDLGGHFPAHSVQIVNIINSLVARGVPPRNLRSVRGGAERSADVIDTIITAGSRMDRPGDKERASARAAELAELFGALHTEYLRGLAGDGIQD